MRLKKNLAILLLGATILFTGCNDDKVISSNTDNYIDVGTNWADLTKLKGDEKYNLIVKSESDTYKIGDKMSFVVNSKKSGFLYVLYTSDKDKTIWLYPNELSGENKVEKSRKFTVPSKDGSWDIKASAPTGKSLLSFFLFTDDAKAKAFFNSHDNSKSYSKDLVAVAKKDDYGVANVVIEVTQ